MPRGFHVRRWLRGSSDPIERLYEMRGNELCLPVNPGLSIPLDETDAPQETIRAYELRTWPQMESEIEIVEFESHAGTYHPWVARPTKLNDKSIFNPGAKDHVELLKTTWREHGMIAVDLESCFNVASPTEHNLKTFGAQFEKTIYFACVGVESLFNLILSECTNITNKGRMSDFVKLKPKLRVSEYSLQLVHYPWMNSLAPFENWNPERPSQSLQWFDAYNSLKHDKRQSQHKASMQNALNAAAAYYILSHTVFGKDMFPGYVSTQFFFHFGQNPVWRVDELYLPTSESRWTPRPLQL